MSLLAASLCPAGAPPADPIRIEARPADGEASLILENRFIQAILLPQRAAVPLTLTYKPTGQELFVRAADLKQGVARQHGNLLCLPWVGDTLKKGPAKGYLRTAEWRVSLEQDGERAACRAEADIAYRDPVTDHPASLRFMHVRADGVAFGGLLSHDGRARWR